MAAIFVPPLPFTVAASSPAPLVGSVANLNIDIPGMVWRGSNASSIIVDLGASAVAYDTVAVIGTNLAANDTVRIRTGTGNDGTSGGYAGTALPAWSGSKSPASSADCIYRLGSTRTERYLRIDFTSSNASGYVQAVRLVIGKAITTMGVDFDAEQGFVDRAVISTGAGYTSIDEYDVLISWKFSTGWISEASWRNDWFPMLQSVGQRRGILFIPDDGTPANWQSDAIFGRFTQSVSGKSEFYNAWRVESTITSIAP
ncbi:hypothetical protein EWE75_18660 [Sphingomonas populi]|uniref:Uncharacterized protein n=1 Tax=Sphingomonas populi TaxID=2484750 RepID=A0A4Q6XUP5_9SPHN|nr:hypothetical protein [Sphingomonas populi]RZF61214.1 hypothetical protein EWE75_18660 [Sphingomonas populi]